MGSGLRFFSRRDAAVVVQRSTFNVKEGDVGLDVHVWWLCNPLPNCGAPTFQPMRHRAVCVSRAWRAATKTSPITTTSLHVNLTSPPPILTPKTNKYIQIIILHIPCGDPAMETQPRQSNTGAVWLNITSLRGGRCSLTVSSCYTEVWREPWTTPVVGVPFLLRGGAGFES